MKGDVQSIWTNDCNNLHVVSFVHMCHSEMGPLLLQAIKQLCTRSVIECSYIVKHLHCLNALPPRVIYTNVVQST